MAGPDIFHKLQLKDQADIAVLGAPESFATALHKLKGVRVHDRLTADSGGFSLAFLTTQSALATFARTLGRHAKGDAVVWVAYPKGTSRRYQTELSRDCGWAPLGALGYEPVRIVSIDDDRSALRFRKAEFIRQIQRTPKLTISAAGRSKASARSLQK
jgi:hypothetical protein